MINYVRPFIYDYQRAIIDSPARYTVCEASTKVGKTASHIIWLLEQALKGKSNQNFWWVAPVFSQAEIAFKRLRAQITVRSFFKVNETKLTLTLPNGAVIQFKSADNPETLYGDDVYAVVMDEFTRMKEAAWVAVRTTLTFTNGKCKFIGNVRGKGWGYNLAQVARQDQQNGGTTYEYFKITAYDAVSAGLLSLEEIEQAKKDLPSTAFKELYLAEAQDGGNNPFGFDFINDCTGPLSTLPAVCFGIDLAKSHDYTVIIGLDQYCHVCYYKRFQRSWQETKDIIRLLPRNVRIRMDSTGVGDPITEDLEKDFHLLEPFQFTAKSKQQIMEGLAAAIQQKRIQFPEGIITDELKNFEYEYTRSGVRYGAPSGLHDDTVCALALALSGWTAGQNRGKYCIITTNDDDVYYKW